MQVLTALGANMWALTARTFSASEHAAMQPLQKNEGTTPEVQQKIFISRNLSSNHCPLYDTPTKYSK